MHIKQNFILRKRNKKKKCNLVDILFFHENCVLNSSCPLNKNSNRDPQPNFQYEFAVFGYLGSKVKFLQTCF